MISRLLGRKTISHSSHQAVDLAKADYSFQLLKDTATEVAHAAANAACVLEQEQRRTKACFMALNSASDIIFIVDNHQNIFFVNDRFLELFHIKHYDDVVGQPMAAVINDFDNHHDVWERIRKNKTWEGVFQNKYKLNIVPTMNGKPEPIYYICTLKPLFGKQ